MSAKKGQDLIGLIQQISGLKDTEMQDIFCSKKLSQENMNPDNLTTDDLRVIAAKMLESLNSEIAHKSPLSNQAFYLDKTTLPQA